MKPTTTLRKALASPRLLGNALSGASWTNWRAMLIAAVGEPLTEPEREIFRKFTGRDREPGQRIKEGLFLIGRRGGKDRATAVLASYFAALVDWSSVLAQGERGLVLCLGANQRQATVQLDYITGVFEGSPMLSTLVTNRTQDTLSLANGIDIEVRAASFRRLRGVTSVAIIASETAFWLTDGSSNPDTEILTAIRPTLLTTGGPLILITTPHAKAGVTYDLWREHYGPEGDPSVLVTWGSTRDFNPTVPAAEIDRELDRDRAAASAEYLAQWRDDLSSYLARPATLAVRYRHQTIVVQIALCGVAIKCGRRH